MWKIEMQVQKGFAHKVYNSRDSIKDKGMQKSDNILIFNATYSTLIWIINHQSRFLKHFPKTWASFPCQNPEFEER